jgi:hypothetical protein
MDSRLQSCYSQDVGVMKLEKHSFGQNNNGLRIILEVLLNQVCCLQEEIGLFDSWHKFNRLCTKPAVI